MDEGNTKHWNERDTRMFVSQRTETWRQTRNNKTGAACLIARFETARLFQAWGVFFYLFARLSLLYIAPRRRLYEAYSYVRLIRHSYEVYTKFAAFVWNWCEARTKLVESLYETYTKVIRTSYECHIWFIRSSYEAYTTLIGNLYCITYMKVYEGLCKACRKAKRSSCRTHTKLIRSRYDG